MSFIDQVVGEKGEGGKVKFSDEELYFILNAFHDACAYCGSGKNMVIVLGRCHIGKSTLINKLRGMEMGEDSYGDLVVKSDLKKITKIGSGIIAKSIWPEAYDFDEEITLLDTEGFLGAELEVKEEVVYSLILQFFVKRASKVMVAYLSQYENYYNLTNACDDMVFINQICKNKEFPILFVANKCSDFWVHKMKIQQKDSLEITEKVQGSLIGKFNELEVATVEKVKKKFPEVKAAQSLEQIIGILLQKAKGATDVQGEEIRRSLNQLQTLLVWKKAHANGRLIYYDPTLDGSEEPIKKMIKNLDNYKSPYDVNLDRYTPSYYWFMDSASSMAKKLNWLVLAMRGRKQIPNILQKTINACLELAKRIKDSYSKVHVNVKELEDMLRSITFEFEESIVERMKNENETIERCNTDIIEYMRKINELDQSELVILDSIEFFEDDNYASNEVFIERPINVPNATCLFIPGNEYTFNDEEEQKLCIEDGILRGAFKAPKALRRIGNIIGAVMGLGIPTSFSNESSVCEGKIEIRAPMRDIPSNYQKIQEYQIKVKECENKIKECERNIDTFKRELDMIQKRNEKTEGEKKEKEKEKSDLEEHIKIMKNEEEKWISRSTRLQNCLAFCIECDEQHERHKEFLTRMYQFAKCSISIVHAVKAKRENLESLSPSSSVTTYSSATPSFLNASASRIAGITSSLMKGEAKGEGNQQDYLPLPQRDENKMTLARFAVAMEEMEAVPQQQTNFELKRDDEYDPELVSKAVNEIDMIWKDVFECKGFLEKFKECEKI
ncbi:uncharacterized protein MONOS_15245 [Monocercomonoides exilis]|uniref:uncharacterized protein n=1 Tax=Monocercomonoides exilis TaxID=2049356 RepID=UPI00355AAA2E|nr:hypothetical protein MONOS_15245 [Monocercomonoides exilis]|eukprot:MONOS_15245.1-p1 / transcript=MONOS_15245.1 / gene=MONOS_15245 / organism=Monocercomonoides_exilis_PA203 / gene_product=unspecified product / transcript_product=unspecified product / location=Mono_scaffold01177:7966-10317(-) / protein_length=784 / sequence_SO=supercontig / SO=protein_coding / is_pseudo=false